jgi:hypothetical protein
MLYDTDTLIEIISNSNGAVTDAEAMHAQKVFHDSATTSDSTEST